MSISYDDVRYETLDGEFMSVGAIEPQFYRSVLTIYYYIIYIL